ncbi:MAG TPA: hypothetical protein VND87_04660 [Stellaceae bacterium]|nr:hypothetical protein [Stellaceae bacterium]
MQTAIAGARFKGIEIFENDLLSFDGTPAEIGQAIRSLGLKAVTFQPFRLAHADASREEHDGGVLNRRPPALLTGFSCHGATMLQSRRRRAAW